MEGDYGSFPWGERFSVGLETRMFVEDLFLGIDSGYVRNNCWGASCFPVRIFFHYFVDGMVGQVLTFVIKFNEVLCS